VHLRFSDTKAFKGATCLGCTTQLAQCVATQTHGATVNLRSGDTTGDPEFDVPVKFGCD
jgi:hypothetical protein